MDLERLGGLDCPLGHCGGLLDSILGHLVAPQSYQWVKHSTRLCWSWSIVVVSHPGVEKRWWYSVSRARVHPIASLAPIG